jgi:DNA-binding PadR family transcriptional regulator
MLEFIILGFLMTCEMSGYDLKHKMSASTSYFFDASFGSIYPALKRLEEKGLISSHEIVKESKYKIMYSINESGKTAFMKWLKEPIIFAKARHDHLVKIFFYELLPRSNAIANLEALMKEVESVLKQLSDQTDEVAEKYNVNQRYIRYFTMIYGIKYYQFLVDWCGDLIENIKKNDCENNN